MEFQWSAQKERSNVSKHGVSFEEATEVFGDPLALTFEDVEHSIREPRYLTFGVSAANRPPGRGAHRPR